MTIVVDPYRLYNTLPIPGWTAEKPRLDNHQFVSKLRQIERVRPNTLLLGNSRVEIGFDPESTQWRPEDQPVYNAALAGAGLQPAIDLLRDAVAVHHPKLVILGLDVLDFLQRPDGPNSSPEAIGADERRLLNDSAGKPNQERVMQELREYLAATVTLDAATDSVATLLNQDTATAPTVTSLGFNPLREYQVFATRQGYNVLFQQKNEIYWRQYKLYPTSDYVDPLRYAGFRQLMKIISICHSSRTQLILFIHPYHADYLNMLQGIGLWSTFENWKRALVRVTESSTESGDLRLIDFSGHNKFSTEPVPPPGDLQDVMRWYWEPGHYKAALGDRMLQTMLHYADGFGVVLNSSTIDAALAAERESEKGRWADRAFSN